MANRTPTETETKKPEEPKEKGTAAEVIQALVTLAPMVMQMTQMVQMNKMMAREKAREAETSHEVLKRYVALRQQEEAQAAAEARQNEIYDMVKGAVTGDTAALLRAYAEAKTAEMKEREVKKEVEAVRQQAMKS
jgi:hypothetical protein